MKNKNIQALERLKFDLKTIQSELQKNECVDDRVLDLSQLEDLNLIKDNLEELNKLKTLVKNNCVGFTLEQVVEKGLYQIYLEQMCDIMCPEPEEEEEY